MFHREYTSLQVPHSFGGVSQARRHFTGSQEALKTALHGIDSYTRHKQTRKVKRYNPIFVRRRRELLQLDLIDLQHLSGSNDRVNYILTVIDTFSRKAYVRPLSRKTATATLSAFLHILREMGPPLPDRIMHDSGLEFLSGMFKETMTSLGIRVTIPRFKASHVERWQRSLKALIFKYMTEFNTKRYIDKLGYFVWVLNNRKHRIINMTPNQADLPVNRGRVLSALSRFYNRRSEKSGKKKKAKFVIGDIVRIMIPKTIVSRGFKPTFFQEFYKIIQVNDRLPVPMYKIADVETEKPIRRSFYEEELVAYTGKLVKAKKTGRFRVRNGIPELEMNVQGYANKQFIPSYQVFDWLGENRYPK